MFDPAAGGDPNALRLTSRLCRACEISERSQKNYDAARLAGEYRVWRPTEPVEPPGA